MPTVELIYDRDCPNVHEARAQLLRAFARARVQARWQERRADDEDSPARVRGYGSPTILVDGRDVTETEPTGGACCRLYTGADGAIRGVPGIEPIVAALGRGNRSTSTGGGWRLNLAMLPGIGASFLPKIACPACWPVYAGFLGSVGLGFLVSTAYLLPLTAAFLGLAVLALAFRARRRRGYGPFALGIGASFIVLFGKFWLESDPAMYAGLGALVAASLWNSWPRRPSFGTRPSCEGCKEPSTQPVR